MARIVVIEDDEFLRPMLAQMVTRLGHEVWAEGDGRAGLKRVLELLPDLVITDMVMPEKEGVETIIELRRTVPGIKIIAISGGGRVNSADYLHLAKMLGAFSTLAKPFSREELKVAVDQALQGIAPNDRAPGPG